MLRIRKFKIEVTATDQDFYFECDFKDGLNIIRGDNSSGKSTLINSITYSLGMEEIIGGIGNKVLPYALKDYVEGVDREKHKIINSFVYIELENKKNNKITIRRAIVAKGQDPKLADIIEGPYLSANGNYQVVHTYLHDKGSAQNKQYGFFSYLEDFLELELPYVPTAKGSEAKLYLQTLFSSMIVEQKRGWTDYIANTPYYAIKDVKTKIVEYMLGLDVFENDRERNKINSQLLTLQQDWDELFVAVNLLCKNSILKIEGLSKTALDSFNRDLVNIYKIDGEDHVAVYSYLSQLTEKIEKLVKKETIISDSAPLELVKDYESSRTEFDDLTGIADNVRSELKVAKARLEEYEYTLRGIDEDLAKNKVAKKLRTFGAKSEISLAKDKCPSCHQTVDDSLLLADTLSQPMDVDENIKFLENQKKMVKRYIGGLQKSLEQMDIQRASLEEKIKESRVRTVSLKKDLRSFALVSETDIRVKVSLEIKRDILVRSLDEIEQKLKEFESLKSELVLLRRSLNNIPDERYSVSDVSKIRAMQGVFRKNAEIFGYRSAQIEDIELNKDTLFPFLSGIELREVQTDIKSDSSASDFVRLIWAYLLAIRYVSSEHEGNHPGLLILDEPAQHSMACTSFNQLIKNCASVEGFQTILGASFDESDEVFNDATSGASFHLIRLKEKLLTAN
ncbi:AAA family ATPase [Rheinheimera sp.]|uniref:AAA family ATPase n=1 Tax=Rheinheimera sp. TaxID=1869214 RepID=UPI003AF4AEB7